MSLKVKDKVYYTRIFPSSSTYDVLELTIRTVRDNWYVGIERRDKQAFLFYEKDINVTIFKDKNIALKIVHDAEKQKKNLKYEIYYEEY